MEEGADGRASSWLNWSAKGSRKELAPNSEPPVPISTKSSEGALLLLLPYADAACFVWLTAKGKARHVCWLCRRGFKSEDALAVHEAASELHKAKFEAVV